jgi:lysophospholipase L1-like esterase
MIKQIREKLSSKSSDIRSKSPVTIAFLGDSVTQGCFELCAGRGGGFDVVYDYEAVYHTKLKKMLQYLYPTAPVNIINAGISGDNSQQGFSRIDRDVLSYSPDLAVVCFGLNDACSGLSKLDNYVNALQNILRSLKSRGVETVFMTPNMMNTYVSPLTFPDSALKIAGQTAEIQNSGVMDAYMEAARKLCAEEEIPVCDCYSKWKSMYEAGVDTTALLSNLINHPTREMHSLFAVSLFEMILYAE